MAPDDLLPEEVPRRRGRPRIRRRLCSEHNFRCYAPECEITTLLDPVFLLPEEIELLRLIDLEGLEQEEAASVLGISRRTVWKDLHEARRKVTDALIHGKRIEMSGCSRRSDDRCPRRNPEYCPKYHDSLCRNASRQPDEKIN